MTSLSQALREALAYVPLEKSNARFEQGRADENARLESLHKALCEAVEALEWIANFQREALDLCRTVHYDMNGKAKEALARLRELVGK